MHVVGGRIQYSVTHPVKRFRRRYSRSKGRGVSNDFSVSPHRPSSDFFQPVLSVSAASNVKRFEGLLILSYTLGIWGGVFQFLEAEAQKKSMMLSEGIMRSKGEVINITKHTLFFTELSP